MALSAALAAVSILVAGPARAARPAAALEAAVPSAPDLSAPLTAELPGLPEAVQLPPAPEFDPLPPPDLAAVLLALEMSPFVAPATPLGPPAAGDSIELLTPPDMPAGPSVLGKELLDGAYRKLAPRRWGLATGLRYLELGRCREAHEAFQHYLDNEPGAAFDPEPLFYDGLALACLEENSAARSRFEEAAARFEDSPLHPESTFNAAILALRTGETGRAADRLGDFLRRHGDHPAADRAALAAGFAALGLGRWAAAHEAFQSVIERHPLSRLKAPAQYWSAVALERAGRPAEAESAYRQFIRNYPEHDLSDDAFLGAARAAAAADRRPAALLGYEELLRLFPDSPLAAEASCEIACLAAETGRLARARELHAQLAARDDPELRERLALLDAYLLHLEGRPAEAALQFDRFRSDYPASPGAPVAAYYAALEAARAGPPAGAVRDLTALAENPAGPAEIRLAAALQAAGWQVRLGRPEAALAPLEQAAELSRSASLDARVHLWRAQAAELAGLTETATQEYQEVLSSASQALHADAWQGQARCALAIGDPGQARDALIRLAESRPGTAEAERARLAAARCSLAMGRPETAEAELEGLAGDGSDPAVIAAVLDDLAALPPPAGGPEASWPRFAQLAAARPDSVLAGEAGQRAAAAVVALGETGPAADAWRRLAAGSYPGPTGERARLAAAAGLYNLGCTDEAAALLSNWPEGPGEAAAPAAWIRGLCLLRMGHWNAFEPVAATFLAARSADPAGPELMLAAAAALRARGRSETADRLLARLVENRPDSAPGARARLALARGAAAEGDLAGAELHLAGLIGTAAPPLEAEALWERAALRLRQERRREAVADLRRLVDAHPTGPLAPAALLALAQTYLEEGETGLALAALDELTGGYPEAGEVSAGYLALGRIEAAAGSRQSARQALAQVVRTGRPGEQAAAHLELGRIANAEEEFGQAAGEFEAAAALLAADPAGSREALMLAGQAAEEAGDLERAAGLYRRAQEPSP